MAKAEPGPRERMIVSTALLMRERGARATSLDAVLEHSGAPRGSVYHHFPGGREQLLREATDYAGEYVARRLERTAADDPLGALDGLLDEYRASLLASDFRAGCPVVAVAVESAEDGPDLREDVVGAFDRWRQSVRARLRGGRDRRGPRRRAGDARRRGLRGRADPQPGVPRPRAAGEHAARDHDCARARTAER